MLKLLPIFALSFFLVNGRLQSSLTGSLVKFFDVDITFEVFVGTPGQRIQVELHQRPFATNLTGLNLLEKSPYNRGFDHGKSSTFVKLFENDGKYTYTINGTDTIRMGGSSVISKPMQVLGNGDWDELEHGGGTSVYRFDSNRDSECQNKVPGGCTTFIESILRDFDDKVLLLAFDKFDGQLRDNFAGQLVLGDKATDLCSKDWTFLPELPFENHKNRDQWTFNVTSVSFDKYAWKNPTGYVSFSLTSPNFNLPTKIYNALLKALNVDGGTFSCYTNVELVFNLRGKELRLKPDVYGQNIGGSDCIFRGEPTTDDSFQLPVSVLSEHCLMYDYKNLGVSITKRV